MNAEQIAKMREVLRDLRNNKQNLLAEVDEINARKASILATISDINAQIVILKEGISGEE